MDIIPVIDLKGGVVVHARGGARDDYLPIQTRLAAGSAPVDVVAGLCAVVPARQVYLADLDAIERRGDHDAVRAGLAAAFPALEFWVDAGVPAEAAPAWLAAQAGCLVLGSESQRDPAAVRALRDDPRVILSLDFRADAFQGPPEILADETLWPARVIVMTLARVGAAQGPDVAQVARIRTRGGAGRAVYAAGGVRDRADLQALSAAGAAGALVATALHSGAIGKARGSTP
jgi:phosphoribosylformimino-5-aminoimidazole carboxamide ribotide isomerase